MSGLRRRLQLTLGVLWLLDAALQYQPYMFSRAFATQTLAPTAQETQRRSPDRSPGRRV
jgi:hypothetical protein